MGFNRRYFSTELILQRIKNNYPLQKYFNTDTSIFTDDVAYQAYKLHCNGVSDKEIKDFILNNTILIEPN